MTEVVLLTRAPGLLPDALTARGADAVVVDPRDLPHAVSFTQRDGAGAGRWLGVPAPIPLDAVWVDTLDVGAHLPTTLPPAVRVAAIGESVRALIGVLDAAPGRVLDRPRAARAACNPLRQRAAVRATGLHAPASVLTDDPDVAAAFADAAPHGVLLPDDALASPWAGPGGAATCDAPPGPHGAPEAPRRASSAALDASLALGPVLLRAHPGPGALARAWVLGDAVLGDAPPAAHGALVQVARALGVQQLHVLLHLGDAGDVSVLDLRPAPGPVDDPGAADAIAAALLRGAP